MSYTVKEIVLQKLGSTTLTDLDVDMAIEEVALEIKQYIHRTLIPNGLIYTHANMVVDYLRYFNKMTNTAEVSGDIFANLGSLEMGDTSIKFGASTNTSGAPETYHKPSLDPILLNYKAQLNRHRRFIP